MCAIFIPFSELCWALNCLFLCKLCWELGLSVCLLGDLYWALQLSVFCVNYVGYWVCLFSGGLMLGIEFFCVGLLLGIGFVWLCYLEQAQLNNFF